jgi:hypothetical protein
MMSVLLLALSAYCLVYLMRRAETFTVFWWIFLISAAGHALILVSRVFR